MAHSPPGIPSDDVDDIGPSTRSSRHSSHPSSPIIKLPRLLSASAHKRPDQPAGLTLAKTNASVGVEGGGGGGVVISSLSDASPFHRESLSSSSHSRDDDVDIDDRARIARSSGGDESDRLLPNDEVLLINSHRVRSPKMAAHMIRNAHPGKLTLVVSRGGRIDGMSYCLVKIDVRDYHRRLNRRNRHVAGGRRDGGEGNAIGVCGRDAPGACGGGGESLFDGLKFRPPPAANDGRPALARVSCVSNGDGAGMGGGGGGPFAKSGLKIGDAILCIDGAVVRGPDDANRMLRNIVIPSDDDYDCGPRIHHPGGGSCDSGGGNIRVVVLLVYSLWELRRKVLHEALHSGGDQWRAEYSHEGHQPLSLPYNDCDGEEYVILRFADTTVSFRLDFNVDGICSCHEPFKSLKCPPNEHQLWQGCNEEGDYSRDSTSRHSRHEMRATLELLYKEYILPTIEVLNYRTLRQLRLLADAMSAAHDAAGTMAEEKGGTERKTHEDDPDEQRCGSVATIEPESNFSEEMSDDARTTKNGGVDETHEDDLNVQRCGSVATIEPESNCSEEMSDDARTTNNGGAELKTHEDDLNEQRCNNIATIEPRFNCPEAMSDNAAGIISTNNGGAGPKTHEDDLGEQRCDSVATSQISRRALELSRPSSSMLNEQDGFVKRPGIERRPRAMVNSASCPTMVNITIRRRNGHQRTTNDVMHDDFPELNPNRVINENSRFARRGSDPFARKGSDPFARKGYDPFARKGPDLFARKVSIDTARPNGFPNKRLYDGNRQITSIDRANKEMLRSVVYPTQEISAPLHSGIDYVASVTNYVMYDDSLELNPTRVIKKPPPLAKRGAIDTARPYGSPGKIPHGEKRQVTPTDKSNKKMLGSGVHPTQEISVPRHNDTDDIASATNDVVYDVFPHRNPSRVINEPAPLASMESTDTARPNGFLGKTLHDENRQIMPIDESNKEMLRSGVHPAQEISVAQHDDIDDSVSAISMHTFSKTARINRRRPLKLQRRPSMVPRDSWKQSLPQSSHSDSDGDSSSSTTNSSGSDDSESSGADSSVDDEDDVSNPQSHPRGERKQVPAERSGERSRKHRHTGQGLSDSITAEIVEYSPKVAQAGRNVRPELAPAKPLTKRLKMRIGDVSKTYKVLHHIIGTGAFGTVRSCIHRSTREKYAVKSITKKGNIKNAILLKNEIAIVQRVNHRHVVKIVDVIQDVQYIHIVMEECLGGDLFDKIVNNGVNLTEDRACDIIGSLLDAIAYLHERDIVHRDLKPEHIMLSEDDINSHIKIIDFGLATIHGPNDPPMTALAGSAFTLAPEVLKRSYGRECDLWSVGVIAYFLLTSQVPFNAKSDQEIFTKIVSGTYAFPPWAKTGLTDMAKDFIRKLVVVDPKQRMTAKRALSHPWIRGKMIA